MAETPHCIAKFGTRHSERLAVQVGPLCSGAKTFRWLKCNLIFLQPRCIPNLTFGFTERQIPLQPFEGVLISKVSTHPRLSSNHRWFAQHCDFPDVWERNLGDEKREHVARHQLRCVTSVTSIIPYHPKLSGRPKECRMFACIHIGSGMLWVKTGELWFTRERRPESATTTKEVNFPGFTAPGVHPQPYRRLSRRWLQNRRNRSFSRGGGDLFTSMFQ